ncbi:MAG: glycoside hydrolase family 3 C-terminal domain-containing protein [Eubacteriales bacterium]|nr:glycoside hydrolase family 3 C-terminal domain-containing protein [Eubacteriales bacterium]
MNREQARQKAEALVSQMTVEEAASQLRYDAPAIDRLGIPAYNWWNEALHGVARAGTATMWPQAIGVAASFDPALVQELGDVAATEGRAKYNAATRHGDRDIYKGLTFWSPNINIFRDPRWGRGHETYGEDPFLTAELGKAYVRGLQGDGETLKSAACAKHFAVHSGPESLRHEFNAVASPKDMEETYLPAFEALVKDAKVEAVMGAYNRTNGEPCCGSQALMVELLRGKWGFEGHFTSDCWAIRDFHEHHMVTATPEESAALALKMGCDVNCGNTYIYMMKAYEQGLVTEEDIRTAAIHLFTTRYLLGIMEGSEFDSIPYSVVECPEHLAKAHQATLESCVLLKNDGLLPLDPKKIKTLAVIGPNANSRHALIGNYYGTSSRYVTVLEGLQDALGEGVRVLYSEGCHLFKDVTRGQVMKDNLISEAVTVTEEADAAVVVVGLDETLEGEQGDTGNADASGDKLNLLLPASQRRMLDAVLSVGKPTVIVLMAGSAIDLGDAADKADAVMLAWYPGARGGRAVAELLLGKKSPSGKLPVTFYHNSQLDEMPAFTDYAMQGRTYRYFPGEPLYPFGYGLTYGDVAVTAAEAEQAGDVIRIRATARNASGVPTDEVVQVYCQNEGSDNAPRNPRLVGFQRIHCPANADVDVEIAVPAAALRVVDEDGNRVEEGQCVFFVGVGQPDSRTQALTGHASVRVTL